MIGLRVLVSMVVDAKAGPRRRFPALAKGFEHAGPAQRAQGKSRSNLSPGYKQKCGQIPKNRGSGFIPRCQRPERGITAGNRGINPLPRFPKMSPPFRLHSFPPGAPPGRPNPVASAAAPLPRFVHGPQNRRGPAFTEFRRGKQGGCACPAEAARRRRMIEAVSGRKEATLRLWGSRFGGKRHPTECIQPNASNYSLKTT